MHVANVHGLGLAVLVLAIVPSVGLAVTLLAIAIRLDR
jgi:hypothetical protein